MPTGFHSQNNFKSFGIQTEKNPLEVATRYFARAAEERSCIKLVSSTRYSGSSEFETLYHEMWTFKHHRECLSWGAYSCIASNGRSKIKRSACGNPWVGEEAVEITEGSFKDALNDVLDNPK